MSLLLALHARLAPRARPVLGRLPAAPPTWALALALDRWLLPRLDAAARAALGGRTVEIVVTDLGLRLALQLDGARRGFGPAPAGGVPALRVAADLPSYLRLAAGTDDADRLFFERALVMEGDTELGLVLKNTLDAIGPLFTPPFGGPAAGARP